VATKTKAVASPRPATVLLSNRDFGKELVNWLFPVYVTMIVVSIFAFLGKSIMVQGNAMSFDRAVLTVVNTATLTGFQQKVGPNFFRLPGQVLVLLLTVAGSLFSLIVGGLAVRRILRLRFTEMRIIQAAVLCECAALLIGVLGGCGIHQTLLGGLSQGASAFGNSGMALGTPFHVSAWQTHLIVLPMAVAGGLGLTVLMELADLLAHGRALSRHAMTVLAMSAILYIGGMLVLILLQWTAAHWALSSTGSVTTLAWGSSLAINSRTAGIPFGHSLTLPSAVRWFTMILMTIGAAPGGTGGGLKVTTIAVIFLGTREILAGKSPAKALGIAMSWIGMYLGIAMLGLVMLLFVEPELRGEQVLYMTISALSNVGLSYDLLPDMPRGSFVLAALMMAGRMTPLLVLWWMADTTTDAEIAVG
jgi:trk system potassium uptake protein TrkH